MERDNYFPLLAQTPSHRKAGLRNSRSYVAFFSTNEFHAGSPARAIK